MFKERGKKARELTTMVSLRTGTQQKNSFEFLITYHPSFIWTGGCCWFSLATELYRVAEDSFFNPKKKKKRLT
jgi:hypothetical protein